MNSLVKAIQNGISLNSLEPFQEIAVEVGMTESEVIAGIKELKENNTIKRFGPVLHNRQIGYIQNAMTTLKVPVEKIEEVGQRISSFDFVTLCYERDAIRGVWDFNLYFMIHGKERTLVEQQIRIVLDAIGNDVSDFRILFSSQCFKQKGANY